MEYAFLLNGKETTTDGLFEIDKDTGLIKLRQEVEPEDLLRKSSPYNLTVLARDDGSCCDFDSDRHTATAKVLIGIEDVNNNKPEFLECSRYSEKAKILEGVYKKDPPAIVQVFRIPFQFSGACRGRRLGQQRRDRLLPVLRTERVSEAVCDRQADWSPHAVSSCHLRP